MASRHRKILLGPLLLLSVCTHIRYVQTYINKYVNVDIDRVGRGDHDERGPNAEPNTFGVARGGDGTHAAHVDCDTMCVQRTFDGIDILGKLLVLLVVGAD